MYSSKILIRNGRIWDGTKFTYGDVALNEKGIVSVGNADGFTPDVVFDAKGDIIAPGLTDIHMHIKYLSDPKYEINGEAVCFPNGVTSGAEAGCYAASSCLDYTALKLRVFVLAGIRNGKADFANAERLIKHYGDSVVGVKVVFDKSAIGECGVEPLQEICEYAHRRGLKVMVHCTNTPVPMSELLSALSAGDICTHVYHGVGHTAAEDDFECLIDARRRGVILDAGLAGEVHTDFAIAEAAVKRNIPPDTISTDITSASAFKRGGKYGMSYAMSMMRLFGMSEEDVMRAVTSSAAKAIGLENMCGVLETGRPSDLTVLRYTDAKINITDRKNHSLSSEKGYACMLTVCDGYIVYRSDLYQ